MKTVLIFGDSIAHGVGGTAGGWTDKIKATMNGQLSVPVGAGCTLYELGIPGNTARDVAGRFEVELLARISKKEPQNTFVVFSVGANDSKAINRPDNFMFTPDVYATNIAACINLARQYADHILCVGLLSVDQTKTNPRKSPLTGGLSYFSNRRIKQFEEALAAVCKKEKVAYAPLFTHTPTNWKQKYLSVDGLHPNDAGYEWIFTKVQPELTKMLGVK